MLRRTIVSVFLIGIISVSPFFIFDGNAQVANTKESRDYKYAAGLYSEGMYKMAISELERFIDTYPTSPYIINARLLIAGSHFYLKDFSRAIQITGRIQREYSPTEPAAGPLRQP